MINFSKYISLPIVLFALAALIRVLWLGDIPGGLNQDEASTGYDAWALLQDGIDRHGISWPVNFIAWGSGQNALYAYLSMPFIALFGLTTTSVRLAAAILGVASVWIFWRLGKRSGSHMGLWALLIIATSPWQIMASRWALESNAAPAVVLFATYCFARARENNKWLYFGSALLAISVYAYGTAYVFAPAFMLCAWIFVGYDRKFQWKPYALSALIAFIIALPMMVFIFNNSFGNSTLHWGPISIPKYPGEARYDGIFLPLMSNGWEQIPNNAVAVIQLLLGAQDDGLPWNAIPTWGAQYWILTPFLMLGIAFALREKSLTDRLMLAWLICALLTAFCTSANINRINLIWLPALWLAARGLWLFSPKATLNRIAQISVFALGVLFSVHYFTSWQARIADNFFVGLGESIQAVLKAAPKDAPIVITNNSVYTSTLFFAQPDPKEYVRSVQIPNRNSPFQTVEKFGRFSFGIQPENIGTQHYWVAHISELNQFNLFAYNLHTFGNYAAVTRKTPEQMMCLKALDVQPLTGQQDYQTFALNKEVDATDLGLPIAGGIFNEGFGVHGNSQWSMELPASAERLELGMGLSSSSGCSDGQRFKILVDNKLAFDSSIMRPGQLKFASIPLNRAKRISFVTEAGASNRCDHGLWVTPVIKHCL
ncbi:hypothetical protein GCM10011613_25990 [Cellvibrio zantedeschiae]|uniref:Glycosyl hydrolase family 98 putative carbohydrate-binding module domain-containing protein n=1 Tax=Cellvibrio zantedeschiae TaxID=1237077 RepID=A0ABQ3B4S2_9GAMM|nr:NPCBM/NEW2 domain-containing protein [Cellvibrio zantedeschiae]GGY79826.1 hypothetical protein GCM10011613_25990 [Cellvibrio zantedeschiae]